jgi:hypothetical protein
MPAQLTNVVSPPRESVASFTRRSHSPSFVMSATT